MDNLPTENQETQRLVDIGKRRSSSVRSAASKVQLQWKDLEYTITTQKGEEVKILNGVSGFANSGQLVALMGSSGAGKTSLLNILSNRLSTTTNAKIDGIVTANGIEINKLNFSSFSGYVTQEDVLMGTLTPRESIRFAAYMKVGLKGVELESKVEQLLEELQLTRVADNLIGSVLHKGLSGGQIKRVCIAIETISDPSLMFLDEPTSGLDSFTAEVVIELLKDQVLCGRTVICTIHQPSYKVFKLFDRLILLQMGNIVYQGPTRQVIEYFNQIGLSCPDRVNPADFFISEFHIPNKNKIDDKQMSKIKEINDHYNRNKEWTWSFKMENSGQEPRALRWYETSQLGRFWYLFIRGLTNLRRNIFFVRMRFIQTIFGTLLVTLIFNNLENDDQSIQTRNGFFNFAVMNNVMNAVFSQVQTCKNYLVWIERAVYVKEQYTRLYHPFPYYLAKFLNDIPLILILGFIFSIISYFALGLNDDSASKWFIFCKIYLDAAVVISTMSGNALGLLCAIIGGDPGTASTFVNMIVLPLVIFNGFFVNYDSIPPGVEYIRFISPFKYAFSIVIINEYTDLDLDCERECDPIAFLGLEDEEIWENFLGLLAMTIGIQVITVIVMIMMSRKLR